MANVKKTIEESLQNIQDDRKLTLDLLKELRAEINSGDTSHGRSGVIAAKYVETLQRSNEQLVKIAAMMAKQQSYQEDLSLSDEETDNIFEIIQGEKANGE
tara:strand:- start:208 stop:510 length:303 start_codon:yes stop_codon:yes gene_type:complete